MPSVSSALAELLNGERYIDVKIDRDAAVRSGLNIADVQSISSSSSGGDNTDETVNGLQLILINMHYQRLVRHSVEKPHDLPVLTARGAQIRRGDISTIRINDGPPGKGATECNTTVAAKKENFDTAKSGSTASVARSDTPVSCCVPTQRCLDGPPSAGSGQLTAMQAEGAMRPIRHLHGGPLRALAHSLG